MTERTLYQIDLDVRFSARYHHLCERMFLTMNDATTFLSLIFGSGAVIAILQQSTIVTVAMAFIVALANAINLTVGYVRKAYVHRDLYRRYQELAAEISATTPQPANAESAYLKIERDDPPIIESMRKIAQIENLRTNGHSEEISRPELKLSCREKLLRMLL